MEELGKDELKSRWRTKDGNLVESIGIFDSIFSLHFDICAGFSSLILNLIWNFREVKIETKVEMDLRLHSSPFQFKWVFYFSILISSYF